VFTDLNATALEPTWSADGNYIFVRKGGRGGGEGGAAPGGIWMYHKDGGQGTQVVGAGGRGGPNGSPQWPSVSKDGRYLYYQVSMPVDDKEPLAGSLQIRRRELKSGETVDITA
jgi:Tol biopolymer transport system component